MKELESMTNDERLVRKIIISYRNEIVGGMENMSYDYDEDYVENYWPLADRTKQNVINQIYSIIMNGKDKYLTSADGRFGIERKHIKFMTSEFIRELIEDRVQADYDKNGWDFPNNYYGDLK